MWKFEILVKDDENVRDFLEALMKMCLTILETLGLGVTASAVLDITEENTYGQEA